MKRKFWCAAMAIAFAMFNQSAQAATITVAPGAVSVAVDGTCSLIEAIKNAEAHADTSGGDCVAGTVGANTIVLAASSTYSLIAAYAPTLDHVAGLPAIRSTTTINGNGATIQRDPSLYTTTVCSGAGAKFRILYVAGDGNLTLNNLSLKNGCDNSGSGGGGIRNHGTLNLTSSSVTNHQTNGSGGGIFNTGTLTLTMSTVSSTTSSTPGGSIQNHGTLTLTQSTVSGGNAGASGGGIDNYGTLNFNQSTLSGNNSPGSGGGIENFATATIANSTLSGNTASGLGGAVYMRNNITLLNSTVAYNAGTQFAGAPGFGSGIFRSNGTATISNSLLVQQVNGTNCQAPGAVGINNLAGDAGCPGATVNAAAQVAALADNGGPTLTHALLAGSAAIDAGDPTICSNAPVSNVDQRGATRPQNGGISNTCDIGAIEGNYGVVYNGNGYTGGSVPLDGNMYANGATVTVLGNTGPLTRTGYGFTGWNTAANGSGTNRAPASTFAMGSGLVTLYAQWALSVNGACGSANGTTVAFAPTSNLCTTGSASGVSAGGGTYGWSCIGSNGGTTASCSANGQATATGTGAGTATVATNGWVFAPQGSGALQTSGFIPTTGHPKSPPDLPPGYSFPLGLFDFVLTSGTAGSTATVTITYPIAVPAGAVYWKYGPSPAGYNCSGAICATPHWYQFPAVIVGNTATLTITDGGLGDDDLTVNGTIVDQGGPGVPGAAAVPSLNEWGMILLTALMALTAFVSLRRQRQ